MTLNMGYDDNLGLFENFADITRTTLIAYHQLNDMIQAFVNKELDAMFLPAGALPYIKNYKIIAQAILTDNATTLQSHCVTIKNILLDQIQNKLWGRVNQYCTTSYWAPLIYLKSVLPKNTTLHFKNANDFQDLLHKAASGDFDCAMVWNIILSKEPENASKVHQLFIKKNLPSPIIITQLKNKDMLFEQNILTIKSHDTKSFFKGFKKPDLKKIYKFQDQIKDASQYFKINIS